MYFFKHQMIISLWYLNLISSWFILFCICFLFLSQGYLLSWDVFWDLSSNLIISGCDSTLTVLGMSAVISSVAHYLGLSILAFIGMVQYVVQYPYVNKSIHPKVQFTLYKLCLCVCVFMVFTQSILLHIIYLHIAAMLMLYWYDFFCEMSIDYSGSTEEEDKRLGFVAPVLFFILALQTGLSSLDPEERLVCDCLRQVISLKNFWGFMLNFTCSLAPI